MQELAKKYNLTQSDFWEMKRGGRSMWIITHDACQKIAVLENIYVNNIQVLNSTEDLVRFLVSGYKGTDEHIITTIGEADRGNCKSQYLGCIAEKRGKDRLILSLIQAYQYQIYSEVEAESFKKPETKKEKKINFMDYKSMDVVEINNFLDKIKSHSQRAEVIEFRDKLIEKASKGE